MAKRIMRELTMELRSKKIGDLTIEEFINLFPKITQRERFYKREYMDIVDNLLVIVKENPGITMWDAAKKMDVDYKRARTAAIALGKANKIKFTKTKNKNLRNIIMMETI